MKLEEITSATNIQLQFSFMRALNFILYTKLQHSEMCEIYFEGKHVEHIPCEYWESYIHSGLAQRFREKYNTLFFGDDDCIAANNYR
jgi:hypothetical protein